MARHPVSGRFVRADEAPPRQRPAHEFGHLLSHWIKTRVTTPPMRRPSAIVWPEQNMLPAAFTGRCTGRGSNATDEVGHGDRSDGGSAGQGQGHA
jgi:hypothetical protein